ncbi:DUF523 domain-containing protein [Bacillus massiliigorillae]|uniref:DUF523 domain-containing protein n=1 Tax=Bacillus massiliigorillae TaxID=1243664 RepID=UPI00039A28BF|nr:DUF523 domain-containing protein [Bacillus massiliigorillae]
MILVSSCLAGLSCRYDGKHQLQEKIRILVEKKKAIMACPELLGGFTTPREPAEIVDGTGADVILGKAKVISRSGEDVTKQYVDGAYQTLAIVQQTQATTIVLKENSPSCGSKQIYNGTFSGAKIAGEGVTTALLRSKGFQVISEEEFMAKY